MHGQQPVIFPVSNSFLPFWSKKKAPHKGFVTLAKPTLFNLSSDLAEKQNVATKHPEIITRLQKHAKAIRAELGDVNIKGSDQRAIKLEDPQER